MYLFYFIVTFHGNSCLASTLSYSDPHSYTQLIQNIEKQINIIEEAIKQNNFSNLDNEKTINEIANLYTLNSYETNKMLSQLSKILPIEFQKKILPGILKNRLPEGLFIDKANNKIILGDHLPHFKQEPKHLQFTDTYQTTLYDSLFFNEPFPNQFKYSKEKEIYKNPLQNQETQGTPLFTPKGDPVGYTVFLPPKEIPIKSLIIRVYGGDKKGDSPLGRTPLQAYKALLAQGIALAQLSLIDLHENKKFQAEMDYELFERVLEGIKTFIDATKAKRLHPNLDELAQKPLFLMGESFGGLTVVHFLAKYPKAVSGEISYNGGLARKERLTQGNFKDNEYMHPFLNPVHHVEKLADPLLLLDSSHDNRIQLEEKFNFLKRAENKRHLIDFFVLKRANLDVGGSTSSKYVGHFFPEGGDLAPFIEQITHFIERNSSSTGSQQTGVREALQNWRKERYKQYANLNRKKGTFLELYLGEARKIYENNLINQKQISSDRDFEKHWYKHYLPLIYFVSASLGNTKSFLYQQFDKKHKREEINFLEQLYQLLLEEADKKKKNSPQLFQGASHERIIQLSIHSYLKELLCEELIKVGFERKNIENSLNDFIQNTLDFASYSPLCNHLYNKAESRLWRDLIIENLQKARKYIGEEIWKRIDIIKQSLYDNILKWQNTNKKLVKSAVSQIVSKQKNIASNQAIQQQPVKKTLAEVFPYLFAHLAEQKNLELIITLQSQQSFSIFIPIPLSISEKLKNIIDNIFIKNSSFLVVVGESPTKLSNEFASLHQESPDETLFLLAYCLLKEKVKMNKYGWGSWLMEQIKKKEANEPKDFSALLQKFQNGGVLRNLQNSP